MNTRFARSCLLLFVSLAVAVANNADLSNETTNQLSTENYDSVHFLEAVKTYLGLGASNQDARKNLRSTANTENSASVSWLRKLRMSCVPEPPSEPPSRKPRPSHPVRPRLPVRPKPKPRTEDP